jgi:hypothetical protein
MGYLTQAYTCGLITHDTKEETFVWKRIYWERSLKSNKHFVSSQHIYGQ